MGICAAVAGASGAGAVEGVVQRACPGAINKPNGPTRDARMTTSHRTAPRRAMVLAAGLGTRMRPHNGQIPKPLVQIGGKALIDYVLDRLADAGVEHAVVNVHHLADQIEGHLARRDRPKLTISDERAELLGTRD